MKPPELDSIEDYRRLIDDPVYWMPYVDEVCKRHKLADGDVRIETGITGTYPVFKVNNRWIVKFFGRLFDGDRIYTTELEAHRIVSTCHEIPIPAVISHGRLFNNQAGWHWPYLIFELVSGYNLSSLRSNITTENLACIIEDLGRMVRHLHSLPVPNGFYLKQTWDRYANMLEKNRADIELRHRKWGDIPEHLLCQITTFISNTKYLIPSNTQPFLLHGDLTADHILLDWAGNEWKINAIIDFGDALVGDPLYELIAVQIDLFQCDKDLLKIYLQAYGSDYEIGLSESRKLLCLCLLHPFNVFLGFFQRHPEAAQLDSLDDLTSWLWQLE